MIELTKEEVEIALVALRHFSWRVTKQIDNGATQGCTDAAWFSAKYCLGRADALIAKLEKTDG